MRKLKRSRKKRKEKKEKEEEGKSEDHEEKDGSCGNPFPWKPLSHSPVAQASKHHFTSTSYILILLFYAVTLPDVNLNHHGKFRQQTRSGSK